MSHRLGVWPGAVKTGEVTGPQEVPQTNLRHAPKTPLFLDLEREEDLTLHELGWLVRKQDVGLKDPGEGSPQSYSRSKRQNRKGTQPPPASSRTKRTPGWRSQMPANTTALSSSAIGPMGKLATRIRD